MHLGDVGTSLRLARCAALVAVCAAALIALAPLADAAPSAHVASLGAAPAAAQLQLVLPLLADARGLERFATAVSTPGSPEHGHYQPIARLARRFGATPAIRARVLRYLRAAGAHDVKIDATGLFADATLSAGRAQRLFAAPLARFSSAASGRYIAPTAQARVPAALRGAVTDVVGLDTRSLIAPSRLSAAPPRVAAAIARAHAASQPTSATFHTGTASGCTAGVRAGEVMGDPRFAGFTPNQYLSAYGFDTLQSAGVKGQGERVALIEIDGFNPDDIRTFASCFGLDIPAVQAFGVGTHRPLPPGGESTLDLEVLDATASDLAGIDVYETRPNASTTLKAMTAPLQNRGHHPQVISASLGLCEPAVAAAVGRRGIRSTESALAMAAASGVTVLASSGDQGSADCSGPGGEPRRRLAVNYPASSPWVTAVGGTNFRLDAANHIAAEVVWNDAGLPGLQSGSAAGGGLSRLFPRPRYQKGANPTKARVIPDVSMLADIVPGYSVFCSAVGDCINSSNGEPWQTVGGTSAGTPLLAGGFALIDEVLRLQKRVDLGLVNPLLYQVGRDPTLGRQVFADVTNFGNDVGPFIGGSGRALGCCIAGAGFDAASGWGSLNLGRFSPAASFLQPAQFGLRLPRHQLPVRTHRILATVMCAAGCRVAAFARIRIGRHMAFQAGSRVSTLAAAGARTLAIHFSKRELLRLGSALHHHDGITATVYVAAIKGRRTIQAQSSGQKLRIRG